MRSIILLLFISSFMSCSSPEELRQKPESSPFNIKEEFSVVDAEEEDEPSIIEYDLQPFTDDLRADFKTL